MPGMTAPVLGRFRGGRYASMRPRLNAGDDSRTAAGLPPPLTCFNEAPAKCRG